MAERLRHCPDPTVRARLTCLPTGWSWHACRRQRDPAYPHAARRNVSCAAPGGSGNAPHRTARIACPTCASSPAVNCQFSPGNLGRIDSGAAQHRRRRGLMREANPPRKPKIVRTLHLGELRRECSRRPEKTLHLVAGIRPVPASTVLNPPSVSSATRQLFINP